MQTSIRDDWCTIYNQVFEMTGVQYTTKHSRWSVYNIQPRFRVRYTNIRIVRCTLYKQVLQCSLHCVIKSRLHISARYKEIWLYYVCTNTTSLANIWQSKMFSNPKRFPTKTITVQKKTKIQGWITRNPTKAECETDQTKQNTQFQFKPFFFMFFALQDKSLVWAILLWYRPLRHIEELLPEETNI
jgi:hypothetical protein